MPCRWNCALWILAVCAFAGCSHHARDAAPVGAAVPAAVPALTDEAGFVPLFNGDDITGWEYGTIPNRGKAGNGYTVNGDIVASTKTDGGVLYTKKQYANFVLRFQFKLTPHANNGIGLRVPYDQGNPSYLGMESQILDDSDPAYAHLHAAQYHGSIYEVVPAIRGHQKPVGEWNEEQIAAVGSHIIVTLNGFNIVDTDLKNVTDPHVLKKHPGVLRTTGRLALLGHGEALEFKNMRVKTLKD